MRRHSLRLALVAIATLFAFFAGELLWRLVRSEQPSARMYFRDGARQPIGLDDTDPSAELRFRLQIQAAWPDASLPPGLPLVPGPGDSAEWFGEGYRMPRAGLNVTWQPGAQFFICYTGPRQDYFDSDGCVAYRFNRFGIRDRDDLTLAKPSGTQRVVCLGDSFTLGWGVRQERNWPVLIEQLLQQRSRAVQVVNCGGAGSSYADEYELALRHRYGRFGPDIVLVTLCLNDLLVTNGKLCQLRTEALPDADLPDSDRRWWSSSRLLADLRRRLAAGQALELDPARDWVQELMDLPADHLWYRRKSETPACYWAGGAPQAALLGIRDWCRQHGARPAVVVWPFLQGLGAGRDYPFAKMHRLVVEFCRDNAIDCLDLLPVLQSTPQETLWVSPADMHPNEHAQQLVAPAIASFVDEQLTRR